MKFVPSLSDCIPSLGYSQLFDVQTIVKFLFRKVPMKHDQLYSIGVLVC